MHKNKRLKITGYLFLIGVSIIFSTLTAYSQNESEEANNARLLVEANWVGRFGFFSKMNFMYNPTLSNIRPPVKEGDQLTGLGFNLGISLTNKKGWGVKYSNTIRYDYIYSTTPSIDSTTRYNLGVNVSGLIIDYNINLVKVFGPQRPVQHITEFGISLMSRGTSYTYAQNFPGATLSGGGDFTFQAINFNYSVQKNRFRAGLGLYYSKSPLGYPDLKFLILSEVKVGYTFKPF